VLKSGWTPRQLAGGRKLSFLIFCKGLAGDGVFGDAIIGSGLEFAGEFGAGSVEGAAGLVGDCRIEAAALDVLEKVVAHEAGVDGLTAALGGGDIVARRLGAAEFLEGQADACAAALASAGRQQEGRQDCCGPGQTA
jgi:hypothetical protein